MCPNKSSLIPDMKNAEFLLPSYSVFRGDRQSTNSSIEHGGALLGIKTNISHLPFSMQLQVYNKQAQLQVHHLPAVVFSTITLKQSL